MDSQEQEELIADYAQESVDNMDMGCMMGVIVDLIEERMGKMTQAEVTEEIGELAPHLLKDASHGSNCAYRNKGECDCYKSKIKEED